MAELTFEKVDLTELMNEGVLMAANERFFWPFGLALTWTYDKDTGVASDLHVRQWSHPVGKRERIDLDAVDPVGDERRERFMAWALKRWDDMLPTERHRVGQLLQFEWRPEPRE